MKRPTPAFSFDEVALLLGLPLEAAQELARGNTFTGPSGLPCRLLYEHTNGAVSAARPVVMLQLQAEELAGGQVQQLLSVQAGLLQEGVWFLGSSDEGQLQVTALRGYRSAREVAAALDVAHLVGLGLLRLLLPPDPRVEAAPAEELAT